MNGKQTLGFLFFCCGMVLMIFSLRMLGHFEKKITGVVLTDSPVSPTGEEIFISTVKNDSESRDGAMWIVFTAGAVLSLAGMGIAVRFRKKK